jgi:hypothetical protein
MKNGTCNFNVTSHGKNVPGRMLKSGTISLLSDMTVVRNLPNQQRQSSYLCSYKHDKRDI